MNKIFRLALLGGASDFSLGIADDYRLTKLMELALHCNAMPGGGFQTAVNVQPALGVEGDFCDASPRSTVDAGAGGLICGLAGVTVGRFAWWSSAQVDDGGAPAVVNNFGTGPVTGFVHREQQGLITTYLADAAMIVPGGFPITLFNSGGFWVRNAGTNQALPGMNAFANFADGRVTFGAGTQGGSGQNPNFGGAVVTGSIGPQTASFTGSISGNVLIVSALAGGTITPGALLGTAGGIAASCTIVSQLSGTIGGVGQYSLSVPEQSITSQAMTTGYALLNVTAVSSGTLGVGDTLTGTTSALTAATSIVGLGTGTGGLGTYLLNNTQTVASETLTVLTNVQTKFVAMSSGLPGELVKINSHILG